MSTRKIAHRATLLSISAALLFCAVGRAEVDFRLDDEVFRRGLIDRGLDELLAIHDRSNPPETDLDLLAGEISKAWLDYRRAETAKASQTALDKLLALELDRIEAYIDHPLVANWRVRYGRDMLNERYGRLAFVRLLGLGLTADQLKEFGGGLKRVRTQFVEAERFLEGRLADFRDMKDEDLDEANRAGLPELYQSAGLQARYLRGWCMFYMLDIAPTIGRAKALYRFRDLLEGLAETNLSDDEPGLAVLRASAFRRLGEYDRAANELETVSKYSPASYALAAAIERIELAIKLGKTQSALEFAERIDPNRWKDPHRRNLVELKRQLLIARAKLGESNSKRPRQAIWAPMAKLLAENIYLGPFVFETIERLADRPAEKLCDLELYAKAYQARKKGTPELAVRLLKRMSAETTPLKPYAVRMLAESLADGRQFDRAVKFLIAETAAAADLPELDRELLSLAAGLAWRAYQDQTDTEHRQRFIELTKKLLDRYGRPGQADRFKLLLADQLSQVGRFAAAINWLDQIMPGSHLFLEAKATTVIVLAREFAETATKPPDPAKPVNKLADKILRSTEELLAVASSGQKQPDRPETWQLTDARIDLIGNALLSCTTSLSHRSAGRRDDAEKLLARYRPIVKQFEQKTPEVLTVRIAALCEQFTQPALIEALGLGQAVIDQPGLDEKTKAQTLVLLLKTAHRHHLEHNAEPARARPGPLAKQTERLAGTAVRKLSADVSAGIAELAIVVAADAGNYDPLKKHGPGLKRPLNFKPDLKLAEVRLALVEKNFVAATKQSGGLLRTLAPQDIRYWHALIINLTGHLALKSDPTQIAAAIVARQQQFPKLGTEATRKQLLAILEAAQKRKNNL